MRRNLLAFCFLSCLVSVARGDALILKDGRKVIGRVTEKKDRYEVQVEGQQLTFDREEVQQWIKSPKEITGDVDRLVDEAKRLYSEAVELKDPNTAEGKFREALPKVTRARELLTEAREFFPEGYTDLDDKLVMVMKLMRLVRERLTSKIASGGPIVARGGPPPPAPKVEVKPDPKVEPKAEPRPEPKAEPIAPDLGLRKALAVLADPAQRADEAHRSQARAFFLNSIDAGSVMGDLATAAQLLLSKSDAEWKVSIEGFQGFFKAAPVEKLEILSDKEIGEGVTWLGLKSKELRGKDAPPLDPLLLLAAGAASSLIERNFGKTTPELDAAFKDFGLEKSEFGAVWGRRDGLAMDDYRKWAASGEYALAVVQFQKDYATIPDMGPKYALGMLLTFKAIFDNRNYNKAAVQFELLARSAPTPAAREHMLAVAKSIRVNSPCQVCFGTHKVNCNICRGKTTFNAQCGKCGGSGMINSMRGIVTCPGCKGVGTFRDVKCEKCKETGKIDCKAKGCEREIKPPTLETFVDVTACKACAGKGILTRHVALACPECLGVGVILRPRADPSKLLK
jgi:hypothetical protein